MNGVLERTLGILELLSQHAEGLELAAVADTLAIPRSGAHRLLADLVRCGYVRQLREQGDYVLTTKLVAMGLSYLGNTGIVDIAQPLLDSLAARSGELARLAVVDGATQGLAGGDRLTWVARAQGSRQGLRYDPDMGSDARLSCSASGIAWLAALPDDAALALVARQGMGQPQDFGPNAPPSIKALLACIRKTRKQGFSMMQETYTAGLNAVGVVVQIQGQAPLGVVTIAGPSVRFGEAKMLGLVADLTAVAKQMAVASGASPFFSRRMVPAAF